MTHISHDYQPAPAPLAKVSRHNNKSMPHCALQQVRNAFCPIFVFIMPERCIAGDDHTKFNQLAHVLRNLRGPVPSQPRWRGQVFSGAPCPICKFLAFSRLISFPGASTSVICPMFGRCIRSFSCLVWRFLQSSDTFRSRAEWSPFVPKGAWCYRGNPGLSLLSCVSLQIEFICVHWNFVRKHLACQLCRRLLRSFVTPVKQSMASSSVKLTYSMRLQRCLFTDACT